MLCSSYLDQLWTPIGLQPRLFPERSIVESLTVLSRVGFTINSPLLLTGACADGTSRDTLTLRMVALRFGAPIAHHDDPIVPRPGGNGVEHSMLSVQRQRPSPRTLLQTNKRMQGRRASRLAKGLDVRNILARVDGQFVNTNDKE